MFLVSQNVFQNIVVLLLIIIILLIIFLIKQVRYLNFNTSRMIVLKGGKNHIKSRSVQCSWCSELTPISAITKVDGAKLCPSCWIAKCKEDGNE